MNFLAHLYLSGNNEELMIGNFIADAIKGNHFNAFKENIRKGILLHRRIDEFTDRHPVVHESKSKFRTEYGKHAGIVVDIIYDHFLSRNWSSYSNQDRDAFIQNAYRALMANNHLLPSKVMRFLPYMVMNDWLGSYIHLDSIEMVLKGMSRRTSLPDQACEAMKIIKNNYYVLDNEFNTFFKTLIEFAYSEIN